MGQKLSPPTVTTQYMDRLCSLFLSLGHLTTCAPAGIRQSPSRREASEIGQSTHRRLTVRDRVPMTRERRVQTSAVLLHNEAAHCVRHA
jgi:hypothetical protein